MRISKPQNIAASSQDRDVLKTAQKMTIIPTGKSEIVPVQSSRTNFPSGSTPRSVPPGFWESMGLPDPNAQPQYQVEQPSAAGEWVQENALFAGSALVGLGGVIMAKKMEWKAVWGLLLLYGGYKLIK